jgi:cbb3-type cytochrome oxidase subunit 1
MVILNHNINEKGKVMRQFKRYVPSMIAKHVTRFFKGSIYIYGIGQFDFNYGKLLLPDQAQPHHYQTVREINKEISKLRCVMA